MAYDFRLANTKSQTIDRSVVLSQKIIKICIIIDLIICSVQIYLGEIKRFERRRRMKCNSYDIFSLLNRHSSVLLRVENFILDRLRDSSVKILFQRRTTNKSFFSRPLMPLPRPTVLNLTSGLLI